MLTIKAEIRKDRLRVDHKYNIKVRFTLNRQVKRLSTSLFATEDDLTKSLELKEGTDIKRQADALVLSYQRKCADLQVDINHYTIDEVLCYLEKEETKSKQIDFIVFAQEWIDNTSVKGKKNYQSALNAFIDYIGKPCLDIKKLSKGVLVGFLEYVNNKRAERIKQLIKEGKRIPSNRAASLYLGSIRHLFNEAKKRYNDYDTGIICIPNDPFAAFSVPKQEATRKRALTPDQIKAIYNLPYRKTAKGNILDCRYNLAKDCFILSFCLIGMNSADLYSASILENNTITYFRRKTTDRRLDDAKMMVDVPDIIKDTMKRYSDPQKQFIFNFCRTYSTDISFNRAINYGLKELGSELGIEDLEFYAARHSWATIALNKVGIDKYTVHAALNHVDESMKVTDIYIERDFVAENNANMAVMKMIFG